MMDHSVSLLYRPKILHRLIDKTSNTPAHRLDALEMFGAVNTVQMSEELITAMNELVITFPPSRCFDLYNNIHIPFNRLIEIVTICSRSLLAFSPKLLDMLVEPQFVPSLWQPLIEIQFGAPKLYVGQGAAQLSFGTVLSAATIFTKALNLQNYTFYDTPINRLTIQRLGHGDSTDDDDDDSADTLHMTNRALESTTMQTPDGNKSSSRSMFTKSLSMTSTTSSATAAATVPSNEILSNLDDAKCLRALEFVLTLLCSQSLLALKDAALSQREKQLIKRELSTELAVFHDFVRKRIMSDARGPLHRKKMGVAYIQAVDGGFEAVKPSASSAALAASAADKSNATSRHRPTTMREKVMRQQHALNAAATTGNVGAAAGSLKRAPMELSPIPSDGAAAGSKKTVLGTDLPSSTPIVSILSQGQGGATPTTTQPGKRVSFPTTLITPAGASEAPQSADIVEDYRAGGAYDRTVFVGSEDATFAGLSLVQMVEADYLHMLSIVFMHICQHD